MRNILATAVASLAITGCTTTTDNADLAALQGQEWRVTRIGGEPVIPNSRAAIGFGTDGRYNGNASCNRVFGAYRLDGSTLTLSHGGLTRMLCQPAEMEQERKFVDLLDQVNSYQIDATGSLVLTTRSGARIVAER